MQRKARFIAGIYNYCDRWCEKCGFRDRCLLFARQSRMRPPGESCHSAAAPMLRVVHVRIRRAVQLLRGLTWHGEDPCITGPASPRGIGRQGYEEHDRARITHAGRFEPLVLAGHVYAAMVDSWMEDALPWLRLRRADVRSRARGPASPPAVTKARELREAIDVILWDRALIPAKLARALSSDAAGDWGGPDAEGSAKVALLSMDRSLVAWETVGRHRRGADQAVLGTLAHLQSLRRDTELRFPGARRFRRPGFDPSPVTAPRLHDGLFGPSPPDGS